LLDSGNSVGLLVRDGASFEDARAE